MWHASTGSQQGNSMPSANSPLGKPPRSSTSASSSGAGTGLTASQSRLGVGPVNVGVPPISAGSSELILGAFEGAFAGEKYTRHPGLAQPRPSALRADRCSGNRLQQPIANVVHEPRHVVRHT